MGWFRSSGSSSQDGEPTAADRPLLERLEAIEPGVPGRCPACGGLGYIDNLDLGHRYQIQHCKDCGHRWEYLFDEDRRVVGLTELDERGQPVSRMRIRPRPLVADRMIDLGPDQAVEREPSPAADDPQAGDPQASDPIDEPADPTDHAVDAVADVAVRSGEDDVIDLRTPPAAPDEPAQTLAEEHMSPAEWLRHSLRR